MLKVSSTYQNIFAKSLLSLALTAAFPYAGVATELTDNTAEKSPVSASIRAGYGSKAQYFREPEENYNLRASASYLWNELHGFGLRQSLVYREYPYEELYTSDTILTYGYEKSLIAFPENWNLNLAPSAALELGTSEQSSARDRRYGTASGEIALNWQALSWLSLGSGLGTNLFFYKETLSKYGEANERHSGYVSFSAEIVYDRFTLTQSVSFIQTKLYEGWEDRYSFENETALGIKLPEDFSLSAGLITSDDQLRYGRNMNFRMYDKDITRFTFSISKKVL